VSTIPYRLIRLVAGAAALLVSVYVFLFLSGGAFVLGLFGLVCFVAGWYFALRFGKPAGGTAATPWLDTLLPFGIALFAIIPALVGPFVGEINVAVGIAIVLPLFAGMSLALAFGPYADQKVALAF
jgi:hypothetical protein